MPFSAYRSQVLEWVREPGLESDGQITKYHLSSSFLLNGPQYAVPMPLTLVLTAINDNHWGIQPLDFCRGTEWQNAEKFVGIALVWRIRIDGIS